MSTPTKTDSAGLAEQKPNPIQVRPRRRPVLMAGGALLVIALVIGFIPRLKQCQVSAADTKQLSVSTVAVVSPAVHLPGSGLDLPAEVKPWQEASIYSRVNGYLKNWLVDIGAHVEQGQLLAEVDVPDLQQQMDQAQSQLALAQRNLEQAKSTNEKYQQLFKQGVVSELDSENQATAQATNQANVEAYTANLKFLQQEVAFQKVTAPFPGVITVRNVNVGDLITANNTSFEMFHIQQMNPLRVYFRIPENEAPNIATGQTFNIQIGADSSKSLPGKVSSTSEAVSPDSRTMLVELQVDNPKNEIIPGSYATVRVPQEMLGRVMTVPDNTLIFRGKSLQVAVVDAKGVVQLRDVKVGRDFGVQSEILSGVTESDKVIVNPSDSLTTGTTVRLAAATPARSATPAGFAKPDASAAPTVSAAPSQIPSTATVSDKSIVNPAGSVTPAPSAAKR
jgi:membrane fusion protein, multidrug efflux system